MKYDDQYEQLLDYGYSPLAAFLGTLQKTLGVCSLSETEVINKLIKQIKECPPFIRQNLIKAGEGVTNPDIKNFLLYTLGQQNLTHPKRDLEAPAGKISHDPHIPANKEYHVQYLLERKNLNKNIFTLKDIRLSDNIKDHTSWIFAHIYSVPYIQKGKVDTIKDQYIARHIHGIQHTTRVAIYIPILANLYRRYNDPLALVLTEEDIKLLQIAALFHDSAREGENEDLWDHESAVFCYHYLTQTLSIEKDRAKIFAEAIANKDCYRKYYILVDNLDGSIPSISWKKTKTTTRTIYQTLLHDADCLDIIRARDHFDARYLDFMNFAKKNEMAFEEMATLITEARSLIALQGDSRHGLNIDKKKQFEHEDAYVRSMESLSLDSSHQYPLAYTLYAQGKLLPKEEVASLTLIDCRLPRPDEGLTDSNMQAYLNHGMLFARGIKSPSDHSKKGESFIDLELRKALREVGVETRTKKPNSEDKQGNPNRSLSQMGSVIASAGLVIINLDKNAIKKIDAVDSDTGHKKKSDLIHARMKPKEAASGLEELFMQQKMGGMSRSYDGYAATHNEILYDIQNIREYKAIYFTTDPTLFTFNTYKTLLQPHSAILQAIFIQNSYRNASKDHKKLPIFEYSGIHNTIEKTKEFTDNEIVAMWENICSEYMVKKLKEVPIDPAVFTMSLNEIKNNSVYGVETLAFSMVGVNKNSSPDSNYDLTLQSRINAVIQEKKEALFNEKTEDVLKKIRKNEVSLFSLEAFSVLRSNKNALKEIEVELTVALNVALASNIEEIEFILSKGQEGHLFNLSRNEIEKKANQYYQYTGCEDGYPWRKTYTYALALQNISLINDVREKNATILGNKIDNLKTHLSLPGLKIFSWSRGNDSMFGILAQLEDIYAAAYYFDVFPLLDLKLAPFKKILKAIIYSRSIFDLSEAFKTNEFVIEKIARLNLIDKETQQYLKSNFLKIEQGALFRKEDIGPYLAAAYYLGFPLEDRKALFLKWKSCYSDVFSPKIESLINYFSEARLFEDESMFFEFVFHEHYRNPRCVFYTDNTTRIEEYSEALNDIRAKLPENKFTPEQIDLLKQNMNCFFEQTIIPVWEQDGDISSKLLGVILDVRSYLKLHFLVPLPDCATKAIYDVLKETSNLNPWALNNLSPEIKQYINWVCSRLPQTSQSPELHALRQTMNNRPEHCPAAPSLHSIFAL